MGEVLQFPVEAQMKIPTNTVVPKARKKVHYKKRKKVGVFNFFGHTVIGLILGMIIAHNPVEFAWLLFGSLLPDIDHPSSTLGKWNPFTRWMTHRGHCHSLFGAFLLSLPVLLVGGWTSVILVYIGCLGHIFGDRLLAMLPKHRKFQLRIW
jgi:membrane-bound metal-dependent hydrolase YbcI (DUF457 family)